MPGTKKYGGSALVLTVLAIAAVSTIALGLAQLSPRDFRQGKAFESTLMAEQAAWAGVEHALLLLRDAQTRNTFFELSDAFMENNQHRPYGYYSPPTSSAGVNCMEPRYPVLEACRGFDRQLGNVMNAAPYPRQGSLPAWGDAKSTYQLAVWHLKKNVGNPGILDDGRPQDAHSMLAANINPFLFRDSVRTLDVTAMTSAYIEWQLFGLPCDRSRAQPSLVATWYDASGAIVPAAERSVATTSPMVLSRPDGAVTLKLQFLLTAADRNDASVMGCIARYSIKNSTTTPVSVTSEAADLGFDVIDAVGSSEGVRRKIRVLVSRDNGRLLSIYDYGLVCETCENVGTYSQ